MPVVAAIAPLVAAGVSAYSSSKDRDAARAAQDAALQQWLSVNVPSVAEQKIQLEHYRTTGTFTPELEQTFQQQHSAMDDVSVDPTSRAAEMDALSRMQELSRSGGMDAQARNKLQAGIDAANTNEKSQRDAIVQNAAAMGTGGSGVAMQAQLLASQANANRASQTGTQAAADAEQRALQAMMGSAQLGSNINSQDFGQAAAKATANDTINAFNTRNSQNVAGTNVAARNAGQMHNLDQAQNTADKNVGISNQQEVFNKGLSQQHFDNQVRLAGSKAGAYGGAAAGSRADADATGKMWSGVGSSIAQGAATMGQRNNTAQVVDPNKPKVDPQYGGSEA